MARLFRIFLLRHLRRRKLRFGLAVASIALAVALSVSMRVTEASILRSFEKSAGAVAGKADVAVTRGTGIEMAVLPRIERIGRLRAAPVIQDTTIAIDTNEPMIVLGIDFARDARLRGYRVRESDRVDPGLLLLDPDVVMVSRSFAGRRGLQPGSRLRLDTRAGTVPFRVAGILDDEGPAKALAGRVVVLGVAAAARHFGRGTRCDRIEVAFDGATVEELRRELGPEYRVEPVRKSDAVLDYLLAQQRTVLLGVTVIAALIGAFIIFNSVSLSVVERVKEIGILRAVGARRREIVGAFLIEAGLLGLAGAAAGIALGVLLSRYFVAQAVRQMNILVHLVDVREVAVPPDAFAIAVLVGLLTSLAGAFAPALQAARVPPMAAIRKAAFGRGLSRNYRRNFWAGSALLLACPLVGALRGTTALLVAMALSFVSLALLLPQMLLWCGGLVRLAARRVLRIEGTLAVDSIVKFPARTALTVLAFAGSLSMIVAISGPLEGTQRALHRWFDAIFPFDLTIQRSDLTLGAYSTATFPESVIEEVERDPRVERAYGVRVAFSNYRGSTVMLIGIDLAKFNELQRRRGVDPGLFARAVGGGVVLSKNFAALHGAAAEVELETADGPRRFPVLGEIEDFSWPRGVVMFDRSVYKEHWKDDTVSYVDVRVREGADPAALKADLLRSFRERTTAFIYDTPEVRESSLGLVRDWFRLADAQVFLAVVIGAIGVINTLLISVLTRARQIALLRAVGATAGQVEASIAFEAGFTGLVSGLLGCAIGLFLVRFPLAEMALRASGYDLPFVVPWRALAIAMGSSVVIGLAAGFVPARFARRVNVVEAIGYE